MQEGAGYYQTTMRNGVRASTAAGYLRQARRRANLKVVAEALATRVLFDGRRATGVEYMVGDDKRRALRPPSVGPDEEHGRDDRHGEDCDRDCQRQHGSERLPHGVRGAYSEPGGRF